MLSISFNSAETAYILNPKVNCINMQNNNKFKKRRFTFPQVTQNIVLAQQK